MNTKFLKISAHIFFASFVGISLSACGGGGDESAPKVDYYYTYTLIQSGMSYQAVRDLIGSDANNGESPGPNRIYYKWIANKGTKTEAQLHITVGSQEGVTSKYVAGYKGTQSF